MSMLDVVKFTISPLGTVTSVEGFLKGVFALRRSLGDGKIWYRGLADSSFRLIPSVGREHHYAGNKMLLASSERELLHRFRRRAYPHFNRIITAGEAIFIARHHGLPTRLLDWTANALYGLYFACFEEEKKDARVWAMHRREAIRNIDAFDLANKTKEEEVFSSIARLAISGGGEKFRRFAIKIVHPFYNSARLLAQDGGFTIHSHPDMPIEDFEEKSFLSGNLDIESLHSWEIPHDSKRSIIGDLSGLGITHRSVYPDLDGIARSLWETEVLWNGSVR